MNTEKFPELESAASENLASKFQAMKEHAEHIIHEQARQMIAEEKAFELSEDEERMLKAYRAFKNRMTPGAVFSWESPAVENCIVIPESPSLIIDPREVTTGTVPSSAH